MSYLKNQKRKRELESQFIYKKGERVRALFMVYVENLLLLASNILIYSSLQAFNQFMDNSNELK